MSAPECGTSEHKLLHPVMVKFLYGQYANLFKFALWWTTLAPFTFALFDHDTTAIGVGRIVYNVALCALSPIGGIVCERVHPRKVLLGAASVRFAIWCVLVPLLWVLFDSSFVTLSQTAVWVLFNMLLMVDGGSVALSTVLDIDLCGVDIVAGRYGLEVSDEHRNQFNGRQELFFAACFTVFTPGMAFLGLAINKAFESISSTTMTETSMEAATLGGIFLVTFAVATALQFYFFTQLPDQMDTAKKSLAESSSSLSLAEKTTVNEGHIATSGENNDSVAESGPTGWDAVKGVPSDLLEAVRVIWKHPPILFRLIFLGLEIAFEDAAIVVIASQMGITLPWLGDNDGVNGNVWTACGVAAGKFGGAIASYVMIRFYHPPEEPRKFIGIFGLVLLSCTVVFVFPATVYAYDHGVVGAYGARALYLVGFFVYFFLSTLPKLGLMCLFQSMVSQVENGPRVFGFIAIIATSFDSLVIMGLSVLFVKVDSIEDALWYTAFIYLAHGVLEMIVGPLLVLRPLQASAETHQQESTEETGLLKPSTGAEPEVSPFSPTGPQTGTYSQRSASILVGIQGDSLTSPRGGASHRTAVLSTSHTVFTGSVARRVSTLDAQRHRETSSPIHIADVSSPQNLVTGEGYASYKNSVPASGLAGTAYAGTSYTRKGSRLAPMTPRSRKPSA